MIIKIIETGTQEYEQMKALRWKVLLNPIGVPASYMDAEKEKHDLLIGAFTDAEMTGCCILTQKDEEQIQLRQMAVAFHAQGKGIGSAIINYAEEIAREKGFEILFMHARSNVVPFYLKNNYEIVGKEFKEVGITHFKMQKQL